MKESKSHSDWLTPDLAEFIRRAAYAFHVRAFGEEMARVNFLPRPERHAYLGEMADHAHAKGVPIEKPALGVTP